MKFFKENPIFSVVLVLSALILIGGLVGIFYYRGQVENVAGDLRQTEQRLSSARRAQPAPVPENVKITEDYLEELEEELERRLEATEGSRDVQIIRDRRPANGNQFYFTLLEYDKRLRQRAQATLPFGKERNADPEEEGDGLPNEVQLPENNFHFGFTRWLGPGKAPPDNLVNDLFLQQQILNFLLNELIAARPARIVSVKREPMTSNLKPPRDEIPAAQTQGQLEQDEFYIGPISAKRPDAVETLAFRIEFVGYTHSLRQFMKSLVLPLIVRSVEVEPAEPITVRESPDEEFFPGGPQSQTNEAGVTEVPKEPIVEENLSRFTITIEYLVDVNVDPDAEETVAQDNTQNTANPS